MVLIRQLLCMCLGLWASGCGSSTETARFVGGAVTGLRQGSLVLGATDGQSVTITQNTSFTLPRAISQGEGYSVFVLTAPQGQSCTIANGTGVIGARDVTDLQVSCDLAFGYYTVGGTVSGLTDGLETQLVLAQGQERLSIGANGDYAFVGPLPDLAPYAVGIAALPTGYDCAVQSAHGFVDAGHIDFVNVACKRSAAIAVTVSVTGLIQDPNAYLDALQIIDAGAMPAAPLSFTAAGAQAQRLQKNYTYGTLFALQLLAPAGMQCTWVQGSLAGDATRTQGVLVGNMSLEVACSPTTTYALGMQVSGITHGTLLASNHQSLDAQNPLVFDLTQSQAQAFDYPYTPQAPYSVRISAPPGMTCNLAPQSPQLTGIMAQDTTVKLLCTPTPARLAVGVSGVTRGSVSVSNGLSQDANNPLVFTTANPNAVQAFTNVYAAGQTATLTLSANQLACYFADDGSTRRTQTLAGDTFVAVRCSQTVP